VLAASLALRSVNILSVSVHITEGGAVDDFLVDAPDDLTEEQLLAAVERGRGYHAWAARADAHSLVDAPTRALDLATLLVRDPAAVGDALAELLDARASWQPDAAPGVSGTRMWVPAPGGGSWLVERAAPSFTPAEYARAQALLAVAVAASGWSASGARDQAAELCNGPAVDTGPREAVRAALLLPDGRELALRRAGPADLAAVRAMHARCSSASLSQRYPANGQAPADAQLARLLAPASGCALVAETPGAFADRVVAVANLVGEGVQAELALLVEDAWQRRGIGTALLRRAASIAADSGFEALVIHTQAQNGAMRRTLRRLDGDRRTETDAGVLTVTLRVAGKAVRAGSR
jgi:GNAT superfamily N-acetyltransferase